MKQSSAWLVAAAATLAMSVSYIDRQVLAVLGDSVTKDLGLSDAQYGLLHSGFALAYLVGAPLAGIVIDRVGARRGLLVAVLVWTAVGAAHALVTSFAAMIVLRILLGLAESPSFPAAAQTMRRVLPPASQSAGIGLLFTGSSFGAMVAGPLAVGVEARFGGWAPAFLVAALVGLSWVPLWIFATRAPDVRARLAASTEPRGSPRAPWRTLLTDPAVLRAMLLVVGSVPAITFVLSWAPKHLRVTYHVPQASLGAYVWMPPVFFDVGAVLVGLIASRRARRAPGRRLSNGDLLLVGALLQATMALGPLARTPWEAIFVLSVSVGGGGAIFAGLTGDMLSRVSAGRAAAAGGLTAASQALAQIVSNPSIGAAFDRTKSHAAAQVVVGLLVLPAALAWILWPQRAPSEEEAVDGAERLG